MIRSPLARLLPFLCLAACGTASSTDTGAGDSGAGTDTETGTVDTGPAPKDEDKDGFDTTVDCDDHNYKVNPDAAEACNGADDNCDGATDEGFDADGDGATSMDLCTDGTDCDDAAAGTYPGAPETPYDDIDQDCDGADLVDVDGDHYDYTFDCDDTNAAVNPGAAEIPKNGLDDDCVGGDSADTDADGYDDENFGGEDCDDADPTVHPGARDYWSDGIDADCDGLDARVGALADAAVSIVGDSGAQALVGETVTYCDLDEDGLDDLIVTAPFGASYAGQIGIWYGSASASWGPGMSMTDADTLIESTSMFLGFGAQCADLDGDGHLDLATTRGEIDYSTYQADFELVLFYGTGGKWSAALDESDADARFSYTLGAPSMTPSVYSEAIVAGDLDGDGAAELLVNDVKSSTLTNPTGDVLILEGKRWSGRMSLLDEVIATVDPGGDGASRVKVFGDLDGDGTNDVFVGQAGYADTADSAVDTAGNANPGRAFFADATMVDAAVADLAWRSWAGREGDGYGWDTQVYDTNADGQDDAVVAAIGYPGDNSGALYFFDGLPDAGSPDDATAELLGSTIEGEFGYDSVVVDDVDGDGVDDLLVSEVLGGASKEGTIWLVSTGLAVGGAGDAESASRLAWSGEAADGFTGNIVAAGDSDGDGVQEYAVGAETFLDTDGETTLGKVYILR